MTHLEDECDRLEAERLDACNQRNIVMAKLEDSKDANKPNTVSGQAILDTGINVFALQLLIESFADLAKGDTRPIDFAYRGVKISLQLQAEQ